MAETTKGSDVVNALTGVAEDMADANVSPQPVLDRLDNLRGKNVDENFVNLGRAKVLAMLGDRDQFPTLLTSPERDYGWGVSPYLHSAEAAYKSGSDPLPQLESAMERISQNKPGYDNHYGRVSEYVRVARVFHKVGLDPNVALSKAEVEIVEARTANHLDTRAVEQLASGFTRVGNFGDAIRVTDFIDVEDDPHEIYGKRYVREILKQVVEEQASGDFDVTLELAKRFNWNDLIAQILAKKAVDLARHGTDITQISRDVIRLCEGIPVSFKYEKVYPSLGLAFVEYSKKTGVEVVPATTFEQINLSTQRLALMDKLDVGVALANAVDEAGYDATEFYIDALEVVDQFRTEEKEWDDFFGVSYSILEDGIRTLSKRGYFELAREYLAKYPDDGWSKSMLMSELALQEAKKGLTQAEIDMLIPDDLASITQSEENDVRNAARYFGLN